jgi:hypothetical protein
LTGARPPSAVGDPPGPSVPWCCCGSTVTVRGGRTNAGIGAAEIGRAKRSRGGGGGARATNSRGRGGRKMTGAGGGGAKPGPALRLCADPQTDAREHVIERQPTRADHFGQGGRIGAVRALLIGTNGPGRRVKDNREPGLRLVRLQY